MKIMMSKYSSFDNYTVESDGSNWSRVFDKLVRLTAKVTESYAGDILIWTNELIHEKRRPQNAAILFSFREGGVGRHDCGLATGYAPLLQNKVVMMGAGESMAQWDTDLDALCVSLASAEELFQQHWMLLSKEDGAATLVRVSIERRG